MFVHKTSYKITTTWKVGRFERKTLRRDDHSPENTILDWLFSKTLWTIYLHPHPSRITKVVRMVLNLLIDVMLRTIVSGQPLSLPGEVTRRLSVPPKCRRIDYTDLVQLYDGDRVSLISSHSEYFGSLWLTKRRTRTRRSFGHSCTLLRTFW